jgi:hypothetical protein
VHLAARNPEQEKLEAEKRAEEIAKLRYVLSQTTPTTDATIVRVLPDSHAVGVYLYVCLQMHGSSAGMLPA